MNEPTEIELAILPVRRQRVMLSSDLVALYGVPAKALIQAVRRNIARFHVDFIFQLGFNDLETAQSKVLPSVEAVCMSNDLKSQIVTSSWGGTRKLPYAFAEQGIAMLSSVLRKSRAVAGQYRNHARPRAPVAHPGRTRGIIAPPR
ncbi:MAG: ORF6N domain-containing protein [Zoogloeaceae bacterium]|jgi:hypothetical protein|nr:ORF6N domain-containing protein [Zoogloeaceae bacterium]